VKYEGFENPAAAGISVFRKIHRQEVVMDNDEWSLLLCSCLVSIINRRMKCNEMMK
jgi:hypothetical protein